MRAFAAAALRAMHWHGYVGMEQEVVDAIAAFVREHTPAAR